MRSEAVVSPRRTRGNPVAAEPPPWAPAPGSAPAAARGFRRWLRGVSLLAALGLITGCSDFRGKGIQYRIDHRYPVTDPQFLRSVSHLIGPGIIAGNHVSGLINGDRIFQVLELGMICSG